MKGLFSTTVTLCQCDVSNTETCSKAPREIINRRLINGVAVFGLVGASRGLDEGNIAGMVTQKSFLTQFGLQNANDKVRVTSLKSTIASMAQLGCIGGSVLAFILLDRIGRKFSLRVLSVLWAIGVILQVTSYKHGLNQLYAGRFISGLGIGMTSVVSPTYIVEISPKSIRGLCTCVYSGSVYLGIVISYFANWGTSSGISGTSNSQWIIPTSLQFVFILCGFFGSFMVVESPRWCFQSEKGSLEENICCLRNLPATHQYVIEEMEEIKLSTAAKPELKSNKILEKVKITTRELVLRKPNLYAFIISISIQFLGQWTGANAITIYAPTFFRLVGIKTHSSHLLATSMLGVVKLIASIACALFVIDKLGRKRALYMGISCQLVSLLYIAIYLAVSKTTLEAENNHRIPFVASRVATALIYVNGIGWALGWNSIQYLMNAEIFPSHLRATASSIIMAFHFGNQFANTKALPHMLLAMSSYGAILLFAIVAVAGLLFTILFIPEVRGTSLESIQALAILPVKKTESNV